jgi:nitroreductase
MAIPNPVVPASYAEIVHADSARPSRRQFLKAAGIGGAVVGVGGLGVVSWRASDQGVFAAGTGEAYAAWREWDQGSGPTTLVRAAILAANPHNTQPWHFAISSSAIDVYVDLARNTGAMDPFRREQRIGLGFSLENLLIAAQAKGHDPRLMILPKPSDPTLIAHVDLGSGPESNSSLYQAIPRRHTSRAPFDTSHAVAQETLAALDAAVADIPGASVVWITSDAQKRQIGQLIVEGAQAFAADTKQSSDSFRWWRDSWSDIQRYKDGMTIDASGASPLVIALGKILPPLSREQNDQSWIQLTRDQYVKTAAAFGVVVVDDATDDVQRTQGGRLYQRLNLLAVTKGLGMQPLNTITERIDREKVLGLPARFQAGISSLLPPNVEPLMTFRIGYPTVEPPPSPRRPAEDVLTKEAS